MELEEFFDLLSSRELRKVAEIIGVNVRDYSRSGLIKSITEGLELRRLVKLKTGKLIKICFKPTYDDGWRWCSKCRLGFRNFNKKPLLKCPICGNLLRSDKRGRKRKIPSGMNSQFIRQPSTKTDRTP